MTLEGRFYSRYLDIFKSQAPSAMQEGSFTPWEAAYVFSPNDAVPIYHDAMTEERMRTFKAELRDIMASSRAQGVLFRIKRKIQGRWTLPGSDVVDTASRDAVVIGLVHTSIQYPFYLASAVMAWPELPPKENPEGRAGLPPIMSDWVNVAREDVPDDMTDLPLTRL